MANREHVKLLIQGGCAIWNRWRDTHRATLPDLRGVDLSDVLLIGAYWRGVHVLSADMVDSYLSRADLSRADLSNANLRGAYLSNANLRGANLSNADLRNVSLGGADIGDSYLSLADLRNADLRGADLRAANLSAANLSAANLMGATIGHTILGNVDLSEVKGLDTLNHRGPSTIGIDTIYKSQGHIPEIFLKEAGVPERFITYMHSLTGSMQPIDYHTCFISYSSKDEDFAKRLYADLQREKVRCWFAPHALRPGTVILRGIDDAIQIYDKLLLILSENSVASNWVEHEVEMALFKEMDRKEQDVLFPIRLDNTVLESPTTWAARLRHRHIADFTCWKNHDDYQAALTRLLCDLKAEPKKSEEV